MRIPEDYSLDRLLADCRKHGVHRLESTDKGVRIEFFSGHEDAKEPATAAPVLPVEVKAPKPDASVEELERAAPEHPLDAILNQPEFSIQAPEEAEEAN